MNFGRYILLAYSEHLVEKVVSPASTCQSADQLEKCTALVLPVELYRILFQWTWEDGPLPPTTLFQEITWLLFYQW